DGQGRARRNVDIADDLLHRAAAPDRAVGDIARPGRWGEALFQTFETGTAKSQAAVLASVREATIQSFPPPETRHAHAPLLEKGCEAQADRRRSLIGGGETWPL